MTRIKGKLQRVIFGEEEKHLLNFSFLFFIL